MSPLAPPTVQVSIVIPAYNEERSIARDLAQVRK